MYERPKIGSASLLTLIAGVSGLFSSSTAAQSQSLDTVTYTHSRVYDDFGRLRTDADASTNPTDYSYDAVGNLIERKDALGYKTHMTYDALNRLQSITQDSDGVKARTQFTYDALDHLIKVTDPRGLSTTYDVNAFGDVQTVHSPDSGTTTYSYLRPGVIAERIDGRGVTTRWQYDSLVRPVLIELTQGVSQMTLRASYDTAPTLCGSQENYPIRRLSSMQRDPGSLTQYCYTALGEIAQKAETIDGQTLSVHYTYSPGGHIQTLTYPDGMVVDYVIAQGMVREVGVKLPGKSRQIIATQIGYYPLGPISGWVFGNGRSVQRTYDKNYRPKQIEDLGTGGLSIGYDFDPRGQLTALLPLAGNNPNIGIQYDTLGHVTQVVHKNNQALIDAYSFDAVGNRLQALRNTEKQQCVYSDDTNRLLNVNGEARTYDGSGNTTAINGNQWTFSYDLQGRISEARQNGQRVISYDYNSAGEQIRKVVGKSSIYSIYDEQHHWLGDYDATGNPKQQAIWLGDIPIAVIGNNSPIGTATSNEAHIAYVEVDHLNTPRVVIDSERNVAIWTWDIDKDAFGDSVPNQDPDQDGKLFTLDLRFPGQRYDSVTGLHQNMYRDYDPKTGRYIQSDPAGLVGGANPYAYVSGNPFITIDTLGLYPAVGIVQPDGTTFIPMTRVKNRTQAKAFGVPEGTPVAIAVPPGCDPQGMVNDWPRKKQWVRWTESILFAITWLPYKKNDYKNIDYPNHTASMYDAYGNFMYGATGSSFGYDSSTLTNMGERVHEIFGHSNSPINTTDIQSGYNAIHNGGTLNVIDWQPQ